MPHAILLVFKKEVNRLINIRGISPNSNSVWTALLFAILKKDRRIWFITNFCQVNKRAKRKPYPLPHMRNLMESLGPMTYATMIDLSMGYYHMHLTQQSKTFLQ